MIDTTSQAFAEISDILNHLDKELYKKIPSSFINIVNKHKDKNYKINIDYSKDINSQILHETKIIIGLMYRDYFISEEERTKLNIQEKEDLLIEEEKLREKYNPDNLFKKTNNDAKEIIDNKECKELTKYKEENLFDRIFKKIKNLLKKIMRN